MASCSASERAEALGRPVLNQLMPLAIECRKPMYFLKPADGAIGAHVETVRDCYKDFRALARAIAGKTGLVLPE